MEGGKVKVVTTKLLTLTSKVLQSSLLLLRCEGRGCKKVLIVGGTSTKATALA